MGLHSRRQEYPHVCSLWQLLYLEERVNPSGRSERLPVTTTGYSLECVIQLYAECLSTQSEPILLVYQGFVEHFACSENVCFDCTERQIQFIGDLLIAQLFQMAHPDDHPVLFRQIVDCLINNLATLFPDDCTIRLFPPFNFDLYLPIFGFNRVVERDGLYASLPQEVNGMIGCDTIEPG